LEAVYLSQEAGFETTLIDKSPGVPARSLVERFEHVDLLAEGDAGTALLKEFDLVIPATETYETLAWLDRTARECDVPLALDLPAYSISSSKIQSNELLQRTGIAIPQPWPECGYPVIVKPAVGSGSAGVTRAADRPELAAALGGLGGEAVIQKYLTGPAYSLELVAHRGAGVGLQVTKLEFDAAYDCKRVVAGPVIGTEVAAAFLELGNRIAAALGLSGIMDVEVIETDGKLEVLEIDARLPSQTPTAVYQSTGINLVETLVEYWVRGRLPRALGPAAVTHAVIYEHYRFRQGVLEVAGEHVLADARELKRREHVFSASVFISNFEASPGDWVATAVYSGETEAEVWETRSRALGQIRQTFGVRSFLDPSPPCPGEVRHPLGKYC
jgi:pyrrolysine biosynthesis protein PylC